MERNGPGGMKAERRSPIITSGVATPSTASNNIAAVITSPASNPASSPAKIAFVLFTTQTHFRSSAHKVNQIARRSVAKLPSAVVSMSSADVFAAFGRCAEHSAHNRGRFSRGSCGRKNFLYALYHHRERNLVHAGVTKRALAQAAIIAWRT